MKKIVSTLMWASALTLAWVFLQYHPSDPTWWHQTTALMSYQHPAGWVGAYCAAFFFAIVGAAALLVPVIIFVIGICVYKDLTRERIQTIILGAVITLLLIALLCEHYHTNFRGASAGGVWGLTLHAWCSFFVPAALLPVVVSAALSCVICLVIGVSNVCAMVPYVRYVTTRYVTLPTERVAMMFRGAGRVRTTRVTPAPERVRLEEPVADGVASASKNTFVKEHGERATRKVPAETYQKPPLSVLLTSHKKNVQVATASYESQAKILEQKLEHFGIKGKVVDIIVGPVVVLFEYEPHNSVPINKIVAREYDLALALQATSFRIIAPIPGKAVVGLEMSRATQELVSFAHHHQELFAYDYRLPLLLGVNTAGVPVVLDLVSLPHLLVAGSTGSGKSVALHTLIVSILSTKTSEETRLILIDPKRLEFASYTDIPHLLFPIVVEAKEAVKVLRWVVQEMDRRYTMLSKAGVTDIFSYRAQGGVLPEIVLIVDEWADLMMSGGRDAEHSLVRLAQMARAAGIHLIVATQRPSVDVITGLIKVNIAARIACKVISKVDSRTIIDTSGAEKLLGKGDMLVMLPGKPIMRVHGMYISAREVQEVACYVRRQKSASYHESYQTATTPLDVAEDDKEMYEQVLGIIKSVDEISISYLQRKLRIGYNRSARMIDYLEAHGMILPSDGGKTRKVLHSKDIV